MGTFEGGIRLNEKFTSGKYYLHFYTNWTSNFIEDDSYTQEVEIINRNEPYYTKSKEPNWKTAKIKFFPESGKILNTIVNKIGIRLTDCNHKGIKTEGSVFDSKSKEITQFKTNEIKFPKANQKEIQVLLEGFSENGQLVSEIRKIPVSNL